MTRKLYSIPIVALLAGGAILAAAHADSARPWKRAGMMGGAPMLAMADTNHDGTVTAEEWKAMFDRLDTDHNGKLEDAELHPHGAMPPEALAYFLARGADTDHDGKVTQAEWRAQVEKLDVDHDGALSASELSFHHRSQQAPADKAAVAAAGLPPFAAHWDTNGDGKLDAAELDALFAAADRDNTGAITLRHMHQRSAEQQ